MDEYCKRSRQIPAFGDWDYANDLPITQYFESARQAGLIRYSSSSGECDQYTCHRNLYAIDGYPKLPRTTIHQRKKMRKERRCVHGKEQRKQGKVCDMTEPPRKQAMLQKQTADDVVLVHRHPPVRVPKPVDEDLYKIPPELLNASKRKKKLGFLSRCLVPTCVV